MTSTRSIFTLALSVLVIAGCGPSPEPKDDSQDLVKLQLGWEGHLQETARLRRQRLAMLPDLLDRFSLADPTEWRNAASTIRVLEQKEPGFVYGRVMELLPASESPGSDGEAARAEIVLISRVLRLSAKFDTPDPAAWTEARQALAALGPAGSDAAAQRLILKLRSHDDDTLFNAQQELVALGTGAVRYLVLTLTLPRVSQYIKDRSVDTLARIGKPAHPAIAALIADPKPAGRYNAARVMGAMAEPAFSETLARAQADEADPLVRCAMLEALSKTGGPLAVEAAIEALSSEDYSVVKFSARALGALEASDAAPALAEALKRLSDPSLQDVRDEVVKALRHITGLRGGSDPAWWLSRLGRG